MKRSISFFLTTLLLAALISSALGQTVTEPVLLSKPDIVKPELPNTYVPGGELKVLVTVDAGGNVSSVDHVDGPGWACPSIPGLEAVHEAARKAAMKAKFVAAIRDAVAFDSTALIVFEDYVSPPAPAAAGDSGKGFTAIRTTPAGKEQENPVYTAQNDAEPKISKDRNYQAGPPPDYRGPVIGSRPLSGGVLNGKAKKLPAPSFPAAARAVGASGRVNVQVLIDETGRVASAEPIAGPPLLRSASRTAACGSEFLPTHLSGKPVKVSGIITYNFTL